MASTCYRTPCGSKLPESRVERQKRTMSEGDASLLSDLIDVDLVAEAGKEEDAVTEPALAGDVVRE